MASPAHSSHSTTSPYPYGVTRDEAEFDSDEELRFPGPPVEMELIDTWRRNGPKKLSMVEQQEKEDKEKEERKKQERIAARIAMGASPDGTFSNCPPQTGKIKNQYSARKTVAEALADCGDDEALKKCVIAATECEEYKTHKAVPADLLTALCDVVGVRSSSRCRFPNCGKVNVRTDRAKEHARVHIGNHPFSCTKIQADETVGCGATFLRKHDRNRHNNGADLLTCEDCGANIQGKGREYNLQRHKSNYCPVRKAAKQHERASMPISTQPSTDSGSSGSNPNSNGNHHLSTSMDDKNTPPFRDGSAMANASMPGVEQVYGPVPASATLPMGRGMEASTGNGQGVEV